MMAKTTENNVYFVKMEVNNTLETSKVNNQVDK